MNFVIEVIFRRRSIRRYQDRPVEREKLDILLQAAMAAPSAMNCRPWEFVIVTEAEKLEQFRRRLVFGNRNAPAAIVVCGNPRRSKNPAAHLFWVQDCAAATENIMLAATSLGLGTVWIGVYPVLAFMRIVRDAVALPRHVMPLCIVYVGYPAEEKPPRTQFAPAQVHWQRYGVPWQERGKVSDSVSQE